MGDIRGVVTANIEDRFRKLAMKKFGYRKGSLSQALEEAICQWIELNKTKGEIEVKVKNPALSLAQKWVETIEINIFRIQKMN